MIRTVLVANNADVAGGGEVGVAMTALGLVESGHAPVIALPREGGLGAGLPVPRHVLGTDPAIASARLRDLAADADVVHVFGSAWLRLAHAARLDVPLVFHAVHPTAEPGDAGLAAMADLVIANSAYSADRFAGCTNVRVVHNGVPAPRPHGPGLGLPAGRRHVGVVGQMRRYKGQLDVLPAVAEIVATTTDIDFVFAGDDATVVGRAVARYTSRLGARVRMLGWVPSVADHLHQLDLVVVPSRAESFGRVAAEALRAGAPVIASPVGALPEVLEGMDGPWLPSDRRTWATAVLDALADPPAAERLRALGARFSPERFLEGVLACYREVVGK